MMQQAIIITVDAMQQAMGDILEHFDCVSTP